MQIVIAGTGYVGLSNAVLLAQHNKVYAVDIIQEKVDLLNQRKCPIQDKELEEYLQKKDLDCFLQAFFGQSCKTFLDIVACPNWTKLQSTGQP